MAEAMEEDDGKGVLTERDATLGEARGDPFEGFTDAEPFLMNVCGEFRDDAPSLVRRNRTNHLADSRLAVAVGARGIDRAKARVACAREHGLERFIVRRARTIGDAIGHAPLRAAER